MTHDVTVYNFSGAEQVITVAGQALHLPHGASVKLNSESFELASATVELTGEYCYIGDSGVLQVEHDWSSFGYGMALAATYVGCMIMFAVVRGIARPGATEL